MREINNLRTTRENLDNNSPSVDVTQVNAEYNLREKVGDLGPNFFDQIIDEYSRDERPERTQNPINCKKACRTHS